MNGNAVFSSVGTTTPIFVPFDTDGLPGDPAHQVVRPGEYFRISIHNAQAAFQGNIFETVNQLVVTSKVKIGNKDYFALQKSREVKRRQATQLGLRPNLISLMPANMPDLSISIDFVLDKENKLEKLVPVINSDAFIAAISLAPGAAAVAKTVTSLASNILNAFLTGEESQPILEFTGNFNLANGVNGEGLKAGYYAILGSQDEENPLPHGSLPISVKNTRLFVGDDEVTQLSYVILEVVRLPVRTRALAGDKAWNTKLEELEDLVENVARDPEATDEDKKKTWQECKEKLKEARVLLLADPEYAAEEAKAIYWRVYDYCAVELGLIEDKADGINDLLVAYSKRVEEAKEIGLEVI